jgi:predicted transcriptional regulator
MKRGIDMTKVKNSKITMTKENVPDNFTKVPDSIHNFIELGLISGNELIVYLIMCRLFNENYGYAFPTIDQLEVMTNLSRGTLIQALKNLEAVGLIEKAKGYRGNNVYVVFKPLDQNELYRQVPEKVELLKEKKIKKNAQVEQNKLRLRQYKESLDENEIKAVKIVPKLESNKVETVVKTDTPEEIEEITKDMSFEELVRFTKGNKKM